MRWPNLLRLSTVLESLGLGLQEKDFEDIPVKKSLLKCANPYCEQPIIFEGTVLYNHVTGQAFHKGQCELYEPVYCLSSGRKENIGLIDTFDKNSEELMLPTEVFLNCYLSQSKYLDFEEAQELIKKRALEKKLS